MHANGSSTALFTPLKVGDIQLQHRIAMAPLTRRRADDKHVPNKIAIEYYKQRASTPGTLLVSEATFISPQAGGFSHVPGIYNEDQIAAWKEIVDAVHAQGSFIYLQLWAHGRAANPDDLKLDGEYEVVGASGIPFKGGATPRPLAVEEIKQYVKWYAQAASNFVKLAGGDGVEIHGANGYLVHQFLETNSNQRSDQYGGSFENRSRFGLEVVEAVVAAVGPSKTAIRLSPYTTFQGMKMPPSDIKETYTYFVSELKSRFPQLAYLHVVESRISGAETVEGGQGETLDFVYNLWTPSPLLVAGGFTLEDAKVQAEARKNTIVVYGRYFLSTPDLVERVRQGIPFNPYNRSTFYLTGDVPLGYIDYPFAFASKEGIVL